MKWWLIILFSSFNVFAEGSCIELEGINIGCVSSVDHGCFMNKAVDKTGETCNYVSSPNTMLRVEGPISWTCKSSKNTQVCTENKGNGDQSGTTCTTVSECIEYFPPLCRETCVPCFDNVVSENVGINKGCIICTRKPCADEVQRLSRTTCPTYNAAGMPLGGGNKCSTSSRCPVTATPPNGGAPMNVTVSTGSCKSPELPEPPKYVQPPQLCTWKVDKRSESGCEPIEPDNRNP